MAQQIYYSTHSRLMLQTLINLLSHCYSLIIIITRPRAHTTKYNHHRAMYVPTVHIWQAQDGKFLDLQQTIAYCYWTDRGRMISKSAIELHSRRSCIKLVASTLYRFNLLCTPTAGKAVK